MDAKEPSLEDNAKKQNAQIGSEIDEKEEG